MTSESTTKANDREVACTGLFNLPLEVQDMIFSFVVEPNSDVARRLPILNLDDRPLRGLTRYVSSRSFYLGRKSYRSCLEVSKKMKHAVEGAIKRLQKPKIHILMLANIYAWQESWHQTIPKTFLEKVQHERVRRVVLRLDDFGRKYKASMEAVSSIANGKSFPELNEIYLIAESLRPNSISNKDSLSHVKKTLYKGRTRNEQPFSVARQVWNSFSRATKDRINLILQAELERILYDHRLKKFVHSIELYNFIIPTEELREAQVVGQSHD